MRDVCAWHVCLCAFACRAPLSMSCHWCRSKWCCSSAFFVTPHLCAGFTFVCVHAAWLVLFICLSLSLYGVCCWFCDDYICFWFDLALSFFRSILLGLSALVFTISVIFDLIAPVLTKAECVSVYYFIILIAFVFTISRWNNSSLCAELLSFWRKQFAGETNTAAQTHVDGMEKEVYTITSTCYFK